MSKFRTGNIIKDPNGNLYIFIKYYQNGEGEYFFECISFRYENSRKGVPVKSYDKIDECNCHYDNWVNVGTENEMTIPDDDCKICKGTGKYTRKICGEDEYTLVSTSAREYLVSLLENALLKI